MSAMWKGGEVGMSGIKEVIRVLGFIQEYFDNHADEQEPNKRKELFVDWSDTVLEAITLLKAQEPRTCSECRHYDTNAFTDMGGRCRNSRSCHYCYGCDKSFGCNAWEGR